MLTESRRRLRRSTQRYVAVKYFCSMFFRYSYYYSLLLCDIWLAFTLGCTLGTGGIFRQWWICISSKSIRYEGEV